MKILLCSLFGFVAFSMIAQIQPVDYADGSQKLKGFAGVPKSAGTKKGILILPAWKGIDQHSKKVAQELTSKGHFTFIADIYGEGNYPTDSKSAGEKSGYYKKNFGEYQKRISLALDQLAKAGADKNNIVIIGYCFGGTGALEAARANMPVRGVVSFHGGLGKDASRKNSKIEPKVLVCHGADDPFVPQADILQFQQEMRDADADWQMIYYADAVHAFTEESAGTDKTKGAAYNAKADKRSWAHFMMFLNETLNEKMK